MTVPIDYAHQNFQQYSSHVTHESVIAGYQLEQKLGSGSFATVYKARKVNVDASDSNVSEGNSGQRQVPLHQYAAIKAIERNSKKITKKVLENLDLEISILAAYKHPNIVGLSHVHKTDHHFYLVLEYCAGGDLQRLIRTRKSGRLTERLARRLMRDLTAGLTFLANHNLIHRDIKPQNLLLTGPLPLDEVHDPCHKEEEARLRQQVNFPTEQFHLKIADFGFARHLQKTSLAETLCGSPLYMAPEILQHRSYDNKADLWSAGTVLYEMIAGRPPFHGENHIDLLRNIQQKAVRLPPDLKASKELVNLLRLLLNRNPLKRAGFKDFVQASEAFVALGCNGSPAVMNNATEETTLSSPSSMLHTQQQANLGPISEVEESILHENKSLDHGMNPNNHVSRGQMEGRTQPMAISPPFQPSQMYSNNVYKKVDSSQHSDDSSGGSGFVMVEKGSTNSATVSPAASARLDERSYSRSPLTVWKQSSSRRVVPASALSESPPVSPRSKYFGKTILSSRNLIPPAIPFLKKGMLSTSPGTGGALVGMMGATKGNNIMAADHASTQQNDKDNLESAAKMLSAADDVGRRAINVAHVGDMRAYLAMRLMLSHENTSLHSSSGSMEGVEKEGDSRVSVSPHDDVTVPSRPRAISVDQSFTKRNSTCSDDDDEDDDEMPFAMPLEEEEEANPISNLLAVRNADNPVDEKNNSKPQNVPTHLMILCHFKEALLCYIKTLTMLKGSLSASQQILAQLNREDASSSFACDVETLQQFKNRCEVSQSWLSGQFKGVLERADAANLEITKLSKDQTNCDGITPQPPTVSVEELIYNHSLACGKDGAVKQLLGQYETARSCYRSAGLLAETLLMEPKLGEEDKKTLEDYVQGFSRRINEIDSLMLQQSRHSIGSGSTSRGATGSVSSSRRGSRHGIVSILEK